MKRRTQAQWRELIQEQKTSGKTAVEFCQEHGLCPNYFSLRKSQLSRATPPTPKPSFIAVNAQPAPAKQLGLSLVLPDHSTLTLPATISAQWVAELLLALRAR